MLWWKRRKKVDVEEDIPATFSERLADIESDHRRIRGEWEDALDRFERIMGRLNKRAQREQQVEEPPEPPAPAPRNGPVDPGFQREMAIRGRIRPGGMGV